MRALVFDGCIKAVEMPIQKRGRGEALIRASLAGICNTDIEATRGYLAQNGILGHEFVGQVVEADDPTRVGKRGVGEINVVCGVCFLCVCGYPRHFDFVYFLVLYKWQCCFADYGVLPVLSEGPACHRR